MQICYFIQCCLTPRAKRDATVACASQTFEHQCAAALRAIQHAFSVLPALVYIEAWPSTRASRAVGSHGGQHLDQAFEISATSRARRHCGQRAEKNSPVAIHTASTPCTSVSTVRPQTATASQNTRNTFMHHGVGHRDATVQSGWQRKSARHRRNATASGFEPAVSPAKSDSCGI